MRLNLPLSKACEGTTDGFVIAARRGNGDDREKRNGGGFFMVTRQALLSQHISCSRARLASAAALRYLFSSREHAALVHLARIADIFAMDVGEGGERAAAASRDGAGDAAAAAASADDGALMGNGGDNGGGGVGGIGGNSAGDEDEEAAMAQWTTLMSLVLLVARPWLGRASRTTSSARAGDAGGKLV